MSNKRIGVAVAGLGFVGGGAHVSAFKKNRYLERKAQKFGVTTKLILTS